jgi:chromosome partitioning protein
VIIDTPPAITVSIAEAIAHADLVVIPTRPSPHDLRALGATVDIIERHEKPLIFVINAATPRARITGEAAVALSQHGTVAPVTLHHRVDFAASMVDGRTVGEIVPTSASAREMRELWTYVQDRLSRVKKESKPVPSFLPAEGAQTAEDFSAAENGAKADESYSAPLAPEISSHAPGEPHGTQQDMPGAAGELRGAKPELVPMSVTPGGLQSFGKRRTDRYATSR